MTNEEYIIAYREADIRSLALRKVPEGVDALWCLRQIEGYQLARKKLPQWAATEGLWFPPRLSMEQCSSETTAQYKRDIVRRLMPSCSDATVVDLTGGFGVDFSYMAQGLGTAVYVEQQEELCRTATHNMPLLGLRNARVVQGDGTSFLEALDYADIIYIDPARRDTAGRKTVAIDDCTPDVCSLQRKLRAKSRYTIIKLSPMLDITQALRTLTAVREIHVVSVKGECKELLLVIRGMADGADNNADDSAADIPTLYVADGGQRLTLPYDAEAQSVATTAARPATYLYEPSAAVLKAGLFRWVSAHYGLDKLHPLTHLYTADRLVAPFPGRTFAVEGVHGFGKREVRQLVAAMPQANLAVRHFPTPAETLRRRFHLRDGGDHYWFATTLADGSHALIVCRKVDHAATALDESPQRP